MIPRTVTRFTSSSQLFLKKNYVMAMNSKLISSSLEPSAGNPAIQTFFHKPTFTFTYVVYCPLTKFGAIIDPVLDYNKETRKVEFGSLEFLAKKVEDEKINVKYILETHAHADHISSSQYLKSRLSTSQNKPQIAISHKIQQVQSHFRKVFGWESKKFTEFDLLLSDDSVLDLSPPSTEPALQIKTIATPGHTPDSVSFLVGKDHVFVGDTVFPDDVGTARCDFPGGNATELYNSIQKIFSLGDGVIVHYCHDYPIGDRPVISEAKVGDIRKNNVHLKTDLDGFVELRTKRDESLAAPKLLYESVQTNINAGDFVEEISGKKFLKLPVSGV
ncbi:hypothetical protein HK098_003535 [Nowakowskiella sp. JEL0407]|nr:hypothetical protein HK098_003535 [Nowakowskiella sp. JEL0407]